MLLNVEIILSAEALHTSQKTVRPSTTSTRDNTATDAPINVKREASPYPIKLKPATVRLDLGAHDASKLRTRTIHENGKETIEILTDSESEPDSDIEVIEKLDDPAESSDTLVADLDFDLDSEDESDIIDGRGIDSIHDRQPSDTVWLDPGLTSTISYQPDYKLNRQLVVDRLEFLDRIPTYWPVPRVPTAYIVDLRDSKFDIYNEKGKLIPVDVLIRNKDQDSYIGGSGEGDSKPELDIFTGQKEKARRVRLHCAGVHACEHVNPDLLDVERYELDPQSLKKVVDAQVQSRIDEADTPEKQAAIFFSVSFQSVPGEPTRYFITCENWTPTSRKHRTSSIPDSIDIQILSRLFAGKPIKGFNSETPLVFRRDAFLPTNEPEYSGITTEDPAILVTYFIRLCYTHAKRGVLELKPHVSQDDYNRLINFVYLESEEQIQEFSTWIQGLEIPKVKAWWKHKTDNSWILSSLIKCRSNMNAEDWALTQASTNIGEGQHHFTNINTGVHLSLVEAIITARELDEKTALEIQDNLSSGVLKNNRNDAYTRLFRGVTRANTVKRKQEEARERDSAGQKRRLEIEVLRQAQKENRERIKELSMQDKEEGSSRKRQKSSASKAESSSSGCAQVSSQSAQRSGVSRTLADEALTVNSITDAVLDAPIDYSIFAQDPPLVYMDNSFNEFDDFALAARWGAENLPALLDISNNTNVSAWSGEEQQVMQGMGSSSTDMHLNLNQQGMESMWTTPLNATPLDDAVFDKFLERFGDY
ncbi:hypothetical protein BDN70DRAFT_976125 [Pholiota conissans]|uniref:Uncharacterized protein n=1 Tax=Pholiota conissans TaxID=109636 RepID=A0A9P5Z4X9_9AGAR|nr:hypothetical protein BDN70DRAFT_976125 [Pholiota conissans]